MMTVGATLAVARNVSIQKVFVFTAQSCQVAGDRKGRPYGFDWKAVRQTVIHNAAVIARNDLRAQWMELKRDYCISFRCALQERLPGGKNYCGNLS